MVLLNAQYFLELEELHPYEELRNTGRLVYLDNMQQVHEFRTRHVMVFLSHQWLGWAAPDPDGVQLPAMQEAIREVMAISLQRQHDIDGYYVWVDYASIAQNHRGAQTAAIAALPHYASSCDVFVIVAPTAVHVDTKTQCDVESYNRRGWCRTEMLSKFCGSGTLNVFIKKEQGQPMERLTKSWFDRLSTCVFEGDFSCCTRTSGPAACNKQQLVAPVLSLYAQILRQRNAPHVKALAADMIAKRDKYFPPTFSYCHNGQSQERELFGKRAAAMEERCRLHRAGSKDLEVDIWLRTTSSAPSLEDLGKLEQAERGEDAESETRVR